MKTRIEIERTYWKENIKNPKEELCFLIKEISGVSIWQINYKEFVEFRYKNQNYDKAKYVFKVNHGNLYYRTNMKKRISDIKNDIQIYEEKISEWKTIEELDNTDFIKNIQYICFKESYSAKCIFEGKKIKIILQVIKFIDSNFHNTRLFNYLEIEEIEGNDIQKKLDNIMKKYGYSALDFQHCKTSLGEKVLNSSILKDYTLKDIEQQIYDIMLNCKIEYFNSN